MNKENKNYSYQYPARDKETLAKIMAPDYDRGNLGLTENASSAEKTKYEICQTILAYLQDNKLSLEKMGQKLGISSEEVYQIGRGNIKAFPLEELVAYLEKIAPDYEVKITRSTVSVVN